jgi:hypothetical protein
MENSLCVDDFTFSNGSKARAIHVEKDTPAEAILAEFAFDPFPRAVIPISGGATHMRYLTDDGFQPTRLLVNFVVDFAFEHNIMLVDGATNTGVMEIIGDHYGNIRARKPIRALPPLLGFVPFSLINYPIPSPNDNDHNLDPNHPYFVLVHGVNKWGDEVDRMFALVNAMATKIPSVALIVNGGLTTLKEAINNISIGREIIVLGGGQRATKVIFAALDGASHKELTEILLDKTEKLVSTDALSIKQTLKEALCQLDKIASYEKISKFGNDKTPGELKFLLLQKLKLSALG